MPDEYISPLSLVNEGSDTERAMVALGALKAYEAGDEGALALYPKTFTKSYLEYGLLGIGIAVLTEVPDKEEVVRGFEKNFSTTEAGKRIFFIARTVMGGKEYFLSPEPEALTLEEWGALMALVVGFVGAFASSKGITFIEVVDYFTDRFMERLASGEEL